ncbi:hypothetical protein GCAAIG_09190 [Candidatus Electronema halotolerans]
MIRYRYALNSSGEVVTAESLAGEKIADKYTCLSCGQLLIARVNGEIRQPHFSHKAQVECNGETYLHRLAKQVFKETYEECLKNGNPFLIELNEPKICDKYKKITCRTCNIGEYTQRYDLTKYYTEINIESRDGQFIPDISLHSVTRPGDVIYIEVAVSHFLSEKKIHSGKRIIEISIEKDEDVEEIKSAKISSKHSKFIGFSPQVKAVPDSQCRCAKKMYFAFYVYVSGKAYLDHGTLSSIHTYIQKNDKKIVYVNLIRDHHHDDYLEINGLVRGSLFIEQVHIAQQKLVPIRNCYLCRYHAVNRNNFLTDYSIFCKTYKKACNSNEAAICDRYHLK